MVENVRPPITATHRTPHPGALAATYRQWHHAEDGGQRGHHHGAQTRATSSITARRIDMPRSRFSA